MENVHETIDLFISTSTFFGSLVAIVVGFVIFVRISVVKLNQKNNQIALDIVRLENSIKEAKLEMSNKLNEHVKVNEKDDSTLRRSVELLHEKIEKESVLQQQKDEKLDGKIQGLYDKIDNQVGTINTRLDNLKDFIIDQIKKN